MRAPAAAGLIELWLEGKYIGGAHRFWSYAPSNGNSENNFDVRVGLYANAQPVAHSVWIDDVRWRTKKEAVDPGMTPVKPDDS